MSANNRFLRGNQDTVLMDVHSFTIIEAGDFIFQFNTNGDRGASLQADNYAYPFSDARATSAGTAIAETLYNSFMGVAMESSPSGVTEKITIAVDGVFKYPQLLNSAVTIGALVVTPTPAAGPVAGASNQTVYTGTAAPGSTIYLGYVVKTAVASGASFVDFQIRTKVTGLAT